MTLSTFLDLCLRFLKREADPVSHSEQIIRDETGGVNFLLPAVEVWARTCLSCIQNCTRHTASNLD